MHPKWQMSDAAEAHMARNGFSRFDMLGFIPQMLNDEDPRPAVEQLDANYQHGGGWDDFQGFQYDAADKTLCYPGDPPMHLIGKTQLRDEQVMLFEGSWVAVVEPDGSYRVSRMD